MKKIVLSLTIAVALVTAAVLSGAVPASTFLGAGPSGTGPKTRVADGALSLEASLDNTHFTRGSDGLLSLNVLLAAREAAPNGDRLPLDLVFVIDRSGSMAEAGKLDYAKAAASTVVDRLGPDDRLGIVIYDDTVEVVSALAPPGNRTALKERIGSIRPRGSTDLAAGLSRGIDLAAQSGERRLSRVVLLSDGLANRGVTDPGEIARMSERARGKGVRVTSLGLGAEFNEDLMLKVAQAGGGTYRFIESPTQMAGLFEKEVGAVMRTVARNVVVRIEPAAGATVTDVFGHPFDRSGSAVLVPVPDLSGGERHSLTVRLRLPTGEAGTRPVADLRASYDDALGGKSATLLASLEATCTEDASLVAKNERQDVAKEVVEDEAARELDRAARDFEAGDKKGAGEKLGRMIHRLETESRRLQAPALANQAAGLKDLQSRVAAAAPASPEGKVLIKKAKEESYVRQVQAAE